MPDMQRKALVADIDTAGREFTAVITTNAVDRDREVLLPDGMDAKDWERNPVVFWNHNYDVPIAKGGNLKREKRRWLANATMAERPNAHQGEWFPDTILALMKQKIIRGVSVGFSVQQSRSPTPVDRAAFGTDVTNVISRWRLFEFSVTALPANQEALITAVAKGLVPVGSYKVLGVDPPAAKPRRLLLVMPGDPPRRVVRPAVTADMIQVAAVKAVARMAGRLR